MTGLADKLNIASKWDNRRKSSELIRHLGSPFIGIAPTAFELTYNSYEARGHYVAVHAASAREALGSEVNQSNGGGSFDRDQAYFSGVAETIERYSAAYVPQIGVFTTSAASAPRELITPEELQLFAPEQYAQPDFPFSPFTSDLSISWVDGVDLRSGETKLLPAQLIYLNPTIDADHRIGYPTSNGLACGPNHSEALVAALLECVERDAVMITWHARLQMPRIRLDSDPAVAGVVDRHLSPSGMNFAALDLTPITGVPTSLAVVWSREGNHPQLSVGAASRATLAAACLEALLEAFHCTAYCRSLLREQGAITSLNEFKHKRATLEDHVRFYATGKHFEYARFLLSSPNTTSLNDAPRLDDSGPRALVNDILCALDEDITCTAIDVTSPDIHGQGLSVVKVLCPQLVPLGVGWDTRYVGCRRIYDVPSRIGHQERVLSYEDLNPFPHPFP